MVTVRETKSLHDVEQIAVKVSRTVKPGLVHLTGHIHHQRVPIPATGRVTHPRISWWGWHAVQVDDSIRTGEFVHHHDLACTLYDLKRKRHIGRSGYTGHVTLGFGV